MLDIALGIFFVEPLLCPAPGQLGNGFQKFGFGVVGVLPAERLRNFQRSVVGALMTIEGNALLVAERARVEAAYRASGGSALNAEEKVERLEQLHRELRPLLAQREVAWRSAEAAGQTADRSQFDPEMFLASDRDLAALARQAAEEATA